MANGNGAGVENLSQLPGATAAGDPERPALVTPAGATSYRELLDRVDALAAELTGRGVGPGRRAALVGGNGPAAVGALLAVARAGGAAALLNPALRPEELGQLAELLGGVTLTLADGPRAGGLGPLADGAVADLDALWGGATGPGAGPVGRGEDPAVILFTSGTTGLPKPVVVSHRAMLARVRAYSGGFSPETPGSVRLMCVPLFHIGGLLALLLNLWSGNTTVIQRRFDAGEWLALVEEQRVEAAFVVPTMLHRILAHPDLHRRDLSSLRSVAYGAAAAPVELVRRAMAALPGVGFMNTFGQTETLGGYTALGPDDHRDPARAGSVGRPLPGVEVRLVEPGTENPVGAGEVGELLVRSEQNVTPGWLRTGDLARLDGQGYLYPMGRLSDTINRGGEKFGPVEVERVLRQHPAVEDAAVAGVPDAEMGERVGAVVRLLPHGPATSPTELVGFCREHLAPFKVPERLVVVDEMPYNELGKMTRAAVVRVVTEGS
jgi:acyl-CoA synthetase (AMP-forming)/AMP-acid ligase II